LRLTQDEEEECAEQHQRQHGDQHATPRVPELWFGDANLNLCQLYGGDAQIRQRLDQASTIFDTRL
jgi:hypothetical protein